MKKERKIYIYVTYIKHIRHHHGHCPCPNFTLRFVGYAFALIRSKIPFFSSSFFLSESIRMTARRGIFFNSKSRSIDSNHILEDKNRSPTKIGSTTILNNDDPNTSSSSNSQTSPPKSTGNSTATTGGTTTTGVVKKKLILRNTKRTLTKTIYSGPRKIFSTSYKVSQTNSF